ncbi:protocadherin-12 [Brienomyrus brachyistius]|uniref:protocadherin-12 n=1 Tax=Brienomyrus brachyistius TaxID=42636 RepID=UPI0020B3254A|nr:protocadherin-12 [Brienomyrus brachyistius]
MLLVMFFCVLSRVLSEDAGAPLTLRYHVMEEQPRGTRVGQLSSNLQQRWESGSHEDFQVVEHGHVLHFEVRGGDGLITTRSRLDREALCRDSGLCEIHFSVLYRQDGTMHFLNVVVEVEDKNDHDPVFPNAEQEVEISEAAALHTRIPLDHAVDPDAGPNSLQTYSLTSNQHFALDVKSLSEGGKQVELVVIKELDRESQSSFELVLMAWDKGNPPRSGSTLVKINVLDSNDNSPMFEDSTPTIVVSENTPRGTPVITVKASDPDQGANGQIEYFLSKHSPLDVRNLFSVDRINGTVTLISTLDYEMKRSYEVDIQARDLGPNAMPSHCKVHVKVTDVNDNAPKIHVTWTPQGSPVATVAEGAADETFLALVMVSDMDSWANGEVRLHIKHAAGHFRLKKIHRDNYMIITNGTLDREQEMEYNLTLIAQDYGDPSLSCVTYLTVHVQDENDNAPTFSQTHYIISVKENNDLGLHVLTVQAHDVDLDLSGKISYSIQESNELGTSTTFFSIHPTSGAVFARQSLDYEESHTFSFVVEAVDHGQLPLTGSTTVVINVQDVNDNAPVIEDPVPKKGRARISVPVNAEKGEVVKELGNKVDVHHELSGPSSVEGNHSAAGQPEGFLATTIRASDLDSGINGKLHFMITNKKSDGLFWLDDSTGKLFVNTSNATELIGKMYEIEVTVSDMGTPVLSTSTLLEITFINLLDHLKNSSPSQRGQLTFTMMLAVCLGVTCLLVLLAVALITTFCRPEKRDSRAYNCRQAESSYTRHPRRPQKQIQKTDIQLVPVLRSRRDDPTKSEAQRLSSVASEVEEPFLSLPSSDTGPHEAFSGQETFPLNPLRALYNSTNDELDGTLPRTPAATYRTLRRSRNSESACSHSQAGTLKRHGQSGIEVGSEDPPCLASPSPSSTTLRRPKNSESRRGQEGEDHRQLLRNLVRLSMAAFGENGSIELSSASPEIQQVSQLLSLLHQGQFQPRPNFRGNKYSHRTGRSAVQDADWLSTKDSGHGESEAGDVDWDMGRDSPIDPLQGEGLDTLLNNTDDVFSDVPDPAWMARLSLPLTADYHENVFVPDEPQVPDPCTPFMEAKNDTCFSTFGKTAEKGAPLDGALLSEVSTLFEMLLTQKAEAQPHTPAQLLYRLSAAYRRSLGMDGTPTGGASPP